MYTDYYALTGRPFQLSPNPRLFFASRAHRRAVASISLGLQQGEGLLVISGEAGSGKTTLSSYLQGAARPPALGHRPCRYGRRGCRDPADGDRPRPAVRAGAG